MATKKISRRVQKSSIWQAMNEPIAYPSKEFVQYFFPVALFALVFAWAAPHMSDSSVRGFIEPFQAQTKYVSYQGFFTDVENTLGGQVAGARIESDDMTENTAPVWFENMQSAVGSVQNAFVSFGDFYSDSVVQPFTDAATELLDVSQPIGDATAFYQPGVSAVWNAWLELMDDPV